MESKDCLVETFGAEIGKALFGAAVKLSTRYGIDLDDVVQDMVIEGLDIQAKYGFPHVNTIVQRTKNALYAGRSGNRYGNNAYYEGKGMAEVAYSDINIRGKSNGACYVSNAGAEAGILNDFVDESQARIDSDLRERIDEVLAGLDSETRAVAYGLYAGYSQGEIAAQLGRSDAFVSKRKQALREAFAWAVA